MAREALYSAVRGTRRATRFIVIHCSATPPDSEIGAADIRHWHVEGRGWREIGYNIVIRRDGVVEQALSDDAIGAHAAGYNALSVGICLVGGIDAAGRPEANYTPEQWRSLYDEAVRLRAIWPQARILGHRDTIDPDTGKPVAKACPCFDAMEWWSARGGLPAQAELDMTFETIALLADDADLLARIAYAEAGNQGDAGQAAIIWVVLNRIAHSAFPSTVRAVLAQPRQFEPVTRYGGIDRLPAAPAAVSAFVPRLLRDITTGKSTDPTGGAVFFLNRTIAARRGTDFGIGRRAVSAHTVTIGDHDFYGPSLFADHPPVRTFRLRLWGAATAPSPPPGPSHVDPDAGLLARLWRWLAGIITWMRHDRHHRGAPL